jgi:hypothetical protein
VRCQLAPTLSLVSWDPPRDFSHDPLGVALRPPFLGWWTLSGSAGHCVRPIVERRVTVQPRCSQGFRRHAGVARTIRAAVSRMCPGRQATGAAATSRRRKAEPWFRSERRVVRSQPVGGLTARPGGPSEPGQPCQTSPSRSTERATKTRSARPPKPGRFMSGPSKLELCEKA